MDTRLDRALNFVARVGCSVRRFTTTFNERQRSTDCRQRNRFRSPSQDFLISKPSFGSAGTGYGILCQAGRKIDVITCDQAGLAITLCGISPLRLPHARQATGSDSPFRAAVGREDRCRELALWLGRVCLSGRALLIGCEWKLLIGLTTERRA